MLDKIFRWGKRQSEIAPFINFGRYSDNSKPQEKTDNWNDAENFFKEKKYNESLAAFFDYLRDDDINNVVYQRTGTNFKFQIYQGSKIVRGSGNSKNLHAKVIMARMQQPSVPVMRRLLEHNFKLYYCRYSLNQDKLIMQFDTEIETANPNKLYYALKELATTADKQDDLLVQDFNILEQLDSDHVEQIPVQEKEIKYEHLQQWTRNTFDLIKDLDPEKYSGGISYLLLALIYRIDFLILPEGSFMHELERIQGIYFKKEGSPVEKNRLMQASIEKLVARPKERLFQDLFRSTSTFAIRQPKSYSTIIETINNANKTMQWYSENKFPEIARQIAEYGLSYCQFAFSLPRPLTEYFQVFMQVNYGSYFTALGFSETYYDVDNARFKQEEIEQAIQQITRKWKRKYTELSFNLNKLKYDNLLSFNQSFTTAVTDLNFETK